MEGGREGGREVGRETMEKKKATIQSECVHQNRWTRPIASCK